jgi:hypothetical protein
MKLKVIVFAALVFVVSACTQTTCPTYTQDMTKQKEKKEINS